MPNEDRSTRVPKLRIYKTRYIWVTKGARIKLNGKEYILNDYLLLAKVTVGKNVEIVAELFDIPSGESIGTAF